MAVESRGELSLFLTSVLWKGHVPIQRAEELCVWIWKTHERTMRASVAENARKEGCRNRHSVRKATVIILIE